MSKVPSLRQAKRSAEPTHQQTLAAEDDFKLLIFGWIVTILGIPENADPTKYNELTDRLYDLLKSKSKELK